MLQKYALTITDNTTGQKDVEIIELFKFNKEIDCFFKVIETRDMIVSNRFGVVNINGEIIDFQFGTAPSTIVIHYANQAEKRTIHSNYKIGQILSLSGNYSFVADRMRMLLYNPVLKMVDQEIQKKLLRYAEGE